MLRIPLRRTHAVALVDDVDAAQADYDWTLSHKGYAYRRPGISLAREILGLVKGDGLEADHINGDRLDNRRSNLRVTTRAQNQQNLHSISGKSRFRGVCWHKGDRKWVARGRVDGRSYWLGAFDSEEEAGAVAAAWRAEHMPFSPEARAA